MKTTALIIALSIGMSAYATDSSKTADTVKTVEIIVPEEKSENDFNIDFPFKPERTGNQSNRGVSLGMNISCTMMFGFVNTLGDNDAGFQMGRSVEFYMPSIVQFKLRTGRTTPTVRLGVGFGLQHFFGKSAVAFKQEKFDSNYPLECDKFPDGSHHTSSKINKFAITMPLFIEQKIGSSGKAAAGAILDFNTHLGATSKYRLDDSRHQDYFSHLAMRPITCELFGAISSSSFGLYVKYVPVNIFKNGFGPNTKNLSVGVVIGL